MSHGPGPAEPTALQRHFQPESGAENTGLWEDDSFQQEEINEAIRAAQATQSWGSIAGELRSLVLASLRPRLDYRRVLRHFRASILASQRELTRMKPSRRYGALYQGSRHPLRTCLLIAVDVSGSISSDDIAQAYGVVARLFQYGVEAIDVLQFDAALQGQVESLKRARREVRVRGGGGTNFAPVLAYIDEHRGYDGLIIITDGIAPVAVPDARIVAWLATLTPVSAALPMDPLPTVRKRRLRRLTRVVGSTDLLRAAWLLRYYRRHLEVAAPTAEQLIELARARERYEALRSAAACGLRLSRNLLVLVQAHATHVLTTALSAALAVLRDPQRDPTERERYREQCAALLRHQDALLRLVARGRAHAQAERARKIALVQRAAAAILEDRPLPPATLQAAARAYHELTQEAEG